MEDIKIDRTAFSVSTLDGTDQNNAYWRSLTPVQRLEAMEIMRQVNYGYDPATDRLQRILEVVKLK